MTAQKTKTRKEGRRIYRAGMKRGMCPKATHPGVNINGW
jgi:hypothetical protein